MAPDPPIRFLLKTMAHAFYLARQGEPEEGARVLLRGQRHARRENSPARPGVLAGETLRQTWHRVILNYAERYGPGGTGEPGRG
jgi:hypothetical protein